MKTTILKGDLVARETALSKLASARKKYKNVIKQTRLEAAIKRDLKMNQTQDMYTFLKSVKKPPSSSLSKLVVGERTYYEDMVPDGFYESMSSLKMCSMESISADPYLAESLANYNHIIDICKTQNSIPLLTEEKAIGLLKRLKKDVMDIYSITSQHFLIAGQSGIQHFMHLINSVLANVENATIKELNVAHGLILYKGGGKDKSSDRSYRTISTCPIVSKAIDLYLRDLYQRYWDECTAATQYQKSGSSHELAALLLTEIIQFSLHCSKRPIFLLVLDAQSAFDRCLRQVLCQKLYCAGISGCAINLIDNRLSNRSTVYEWNGIMLGPSPDQTGFEQGGINSADYYKLYNNEQLDCAQASKLGVNISSSVISAIGQADDVILPSNDIRNLKLLANLTENYCARHRVTLVPNKTKLLAIHDKNTEQEVNYAKLINPITIAGKQVDFVQEAEHVGILRSQNGNIPNLQRRISAHKRALATLCHAGVAKGQRGSPASALKLHNLYGTSVLLSGLASLVLNKAEIKMLENHFKGTLQSIQRLEQGTPRSAIYLLAGSLPVEALLHCRQLSLFSMVCRLKDNPLHRHAKYILTTSVTYRNSWFHQVRDICLKYNLPHPLELLDTIPTKFMFKKYVKSQVHQYWYGVFSREATDGTLTSLKYFNILSCSVQKPHMIWACSMHHPFETAKSTIVAKMITGRYRTDMLKRHWSDNKEGYCMAYTCHKVKGDLAHMLIVCPALEHTREKIRTMWYIKSSMLPSLQALILSVWKMSPELQVQFILDPMFFSEVVHLYQTFGYYVLHQLLYLTRTYAFHMHKSKLELERLMHS